MAGQRKRKHASVEDQSSKQTVLGQTQQGIKAYGTIGKSNASDDGLKKRKTIHQREPTPPPVSQARPSTGAKKRKRALETVDEDDVEDDHARKQATEDRILKKFTKSGMSTPRNKRFKSVQPPSPVDTPSKSAAALFNKLKLDTATQPIHFALAANQKAYDTPPDTPDTENHDTDCLPQELEDLLVLHTAFLSALSLYFAHNGTSSPVNIKTLLPLITKSWKRRSVSLDDLRTLLAFDQGSDASFTLQDYGRAGICLMRSHPRGRAMKRAASYVDEADLNARFEDALQKKWRNWVLANANKNCSAATFMDQLPLAEITKSESVDKAAPLFARGQERLADLKASQAAAKPAHVMASDIGAEHKTNPAVQNRGTSLLDRILAKQAHAASLPAGPTRKHLERKAALHRVEDIARVLDLLSAGRSRCSFSMTAMVQHLQQSLRNPISKEEVERCLGLMAEEITPGFVSLISSGSVTGVMVLKSGKIALEDLRQRVQIACA